MPGHVVVQEHTIAFKGEHGCIAVERQSTERSDVRTLHERAVALGDVFRIGNVQEAEIGEGAVHEHQFLAPTFSLAEVREDKVRSRRIGNGEERWQHRPAIIAAAGVGDDLCVTVRQEFVAHQSYAFELRLHVPGHHHEGAVAHVKGGLDKKRVMTDVVVQRGEDRGLRAVFDRWRRGLLVLGLRSTANAGDNER